MTSPAVTALRLSRIQMSAYAGASAPTVLEGAVVPTSENQIDALRVVVECLVLAR